MFIEIEKNIRNNSYKTHRTITLKEVLKKHPYCLDLHGWMKGARPNSRFGLANNKGNFLYINTEETDKEKLDNLVRNL